jgi:hypothetical protein
MMLTGTCRKPNHLEKIEIVCRNATLQQTMPGRSDRRARAAAILREQGATLRLPPGDASNRKPNRSRQGDVVARMTRNKARSRPSAGLSENERIRRQFFSLLRRATQPFAGRWALWPCGFGKLLAMQRNAAYCGAIPSQQESVFRRLTTVARR